MRAPFAVTEGLVLLLTALPASSAGPVSWRPVGPWGDTVYTLVLDPTSPKTLYAGTREGLFKSTDGAGTWRAMNKGLEKTSVVSLAIDPKSPKTLYAGRFRGGLSKSTDGGATWKNPSTAKGYDANALITQIELRSVAVDPFDGKHVMATSLYGSTNGGASWTMVNVQKYEDGGFRDVNGITFDPKTPKVVYTADVGSPKRSTDGGLSFKKIDVGIPDPVHAKVVAIDPTDSRNVLIGSRNGFFRSTDGSKTWEHGADGLPLSATIEAIAFDPSSPRTVYVAATIRSGDGSVFRSTDGGDSFEDLGGDLPYAVVFALAVDPSSPDTLYAGADCGVYRSTDGGKTWDERNTGFVGAERSVVAVAGVSAAGARAGALYASTYEGLYASTDDGKSWRRAKGLDKGRRSTILGVNGENPEIVIVGDKEESPARSTDRGETWSVAVGGPGLRCLVPGTGDGNLFYGCAEQRRGGGMTRTVDGGASWRPFGADDLSTIVSLALDPSSREVMSAAVLGGGFVRSTNGGKKWKESNKSLTLQKGSLTSFAEYRRLFDLVVDPASPRTLFAATEKEGVFRSADGGETWSAVGLAGEKVKALVLDPGRKRLAVLLDEKGIQLSTDGGATWTDTTGDLPAKKLLTLAVERGGAGRLLVGTKGSGMFIGE